MRIKLFVFFGAVSILWVPWVQAEETPKNEGGLILYSRVLHPRILPREDRAPAHLPGEWDHSSWRPVDFFESEVKAVAAQSYFPPEGADAWEGWFAKGLAVQSHGLEHAASSSTRICVYLRGVVGHTATLSYHRVVTEIQHYRYGNQPSDRTRDVVEAEPIESFAVPVSELKQLTQDIMEEGDRLARALNRWRSLSVTPSRSVEGFERSLGFEGATGRDKGRRYGMRTSFSSIDSVPVPVYLVGLVERYKHMRATCLASEIHDLSVSSVAVRFLKIDHLYFLPEEVFQAFLNPQNPDAMPHYAALLKHMKDYTELRIKVPKHLLTPEERLVYVDRWTSRLLTELPQYGVIPRGIDLSWIQTFWRSAKVCSDLLRY